MYQAWIEIDLNCVRNNYRNLQKILYSGSEIMPVVKADGYGHGALKIAEVLREEGAKRFAVFLLEEGIELREKGFEEPILIMGYVPEEHYEKILQYKLTKTIYDFSQAVKLNNAAQKQNSTAAVHIKIDTGMGRLGFIPGEEAVSEIQKILGLSNVHMEGIYSQLAAADKFRYNYSTNQFKLFTDFIEHLAHYGITFPLKHIANSAAVINYPEMHLDLARTGISIYGIFPSIEMEENSYLELFPVMSVKSKLACIKEVPVGTFISYGLTYKTDKKSLIGVVPMGYADGVLRLLSNNSDVLVRGKRCPIVGSVCMDQFMVDLTDLSDVELKDEVVLIGKQGNEKITAHEIAQKSSTISYEVISRMGKRLPRIYSDNY